MTWKLNGRTLGDAETSVVIEPDSLQAALTYNLASYARRGARPTHQGLTSGPDAFDLRFRITGTQTGIGQWVAAILDELETPVATLQATHVDPPPLYRDATRVALRAVSAAQVIGAGLASQVLEVSCVLEGIWVTDGGAFCQIQGGIFTQTATGFEDAAGVEAASGFPEVTLPVQFTGYPIARKPDGTVGAPSLLRYEWEANADGEPLRYAVYDFTGYLTAAPVSTGDVAVYEVCSSPVSDFLEASFPRSSAAPFIFGEAVAVGALLAQASAPLSSLGFTDLAATPSLRRAGSSALEALTWAEVSAVSTLLAPLLTETGEAITTEAGEDILVQV